MKKWLFRILFLMTAVSAIFCFTGFDVTCTGEYQGISCGIDSCGYSHSHSYKKLEETESTCGEAGYVIYECRTCHNIKTEYKSKPEHTLTHTLHRGTCDLTGLEEITKLDTSWYEEDICSECGYIGRNFYFEGYDTLHYFNEGEITQYDDGSGCGEIKQVCLICGVEQSSNYHSEESPQIKELHEKKNSSASQDRCGSYLRNCELCNRTVYELWHDFYYEEVLVPPTQTEYGLARLRCCNVVFNGYCNLVGSNTKYYLLPPTNEVN